MDIRIEKYCAECQPLWNQFIKDSKNGFFLFEREYMEYHADRFTDHSLLFYVENQLLCLLPANEKENVLYSHGGLTFGGFIMSRKASIIDMQRAFNSLIEYLKKLEFKSFVYKPIPFIYQRIPAQEDLYVLFRAKAHLFRRDINSVIDLTQKISYTKGTKSNLSKARKSNLQLMESNEFELFMKIQEGILKTKYNKVPTHTAEELKILASRFPENIKLYLVYNNAGCLGGTLLYITDLVVHTQYIAITDEGKEVGALDFLTDHLIKNSLGLKRYFSFGISSDQEGLYLNEGLVKNKESFGARASVNDFYRIELS